MSPVTWIELNTSQETTPNQDYGLAPDVLEFLKYANVARIINLSARAILITMGIVTSIFASGLLWKRRSKHSLVFITLLMNILLTCIVHFGYNLLVDTINLSKWFEYRKGDAMCRIDTFLLYTCTMALVYQIICFLLLTILNKIKPIWIRAINTSKSVTLAVVVFWIIVLVCNVHRLINRGLVHFLSRAYCAPLTESDAQSYFLFISQFMAIQLFPCIVIMLVCALLVCFRRCKDTDMDPSSHSQYRKFSIYLAILFIMSHLPLALYHLVLLGGYQTLDTNIAAYFIKDVLLFCDRLYSTFIPGCMLLSLRFTYKQNQEKPYDQMTLLEGENTV